MVDNVKLVEKVNCVKPNLYFTAKIDYQYEHITN